MSIGKNSVARAAKATAKPAEEVKTEAISAPVQETPAEPVTETAEPKAQIPEKFKNVQVGDGMPAFLL